MTEDVRQAKRPVSPLLAIPTGTRAFRTSRSTTSAPVTPLTGLNA